jgi:hypothetical protein
MKELKEPKHGRHLISRNDGWRETKIEMFRRRNKTRPAQENLPKIRAPRKPLSAPKGGWKESRPIEERILARKGKSPDTPAIHRPGVDDVKRNRDFPQRRRAN